MEEPHEHWRTACVYEGVNGVNISCFRRLQLQLVLLFMCSPILASCRRPVPLLNLHYLLQIVVLAQYARAIHFRSRKERRLHA
jgi:hypothetical protein